jgi:endonuclease/exonuclease/phosphatase family metal-dependent hydrolase
MPRALIAAVVASLLLLGTAGVSATPTPPDDGAPGTTLDVLTFNAFLRPFLPERQNERMELMAGELAGYDVLLLQELFSDWHRRKLLRALEDDYPHQSRVLGHDRGLGQDGGVVIVSKWPIELEFQRLFGALCAGKDCFAEKGVLYARINKQGRRFHVFATHLQSGADNAELRAAQLAGIKDLIDRMRLPADEPVLIGGDLNVDRLADEQTGAFTAMTRLLGAAHPPPPADGSRRPSLDPEQNPLVGGGRAQYLDYVLYSQDHLRPTSAFNTVTPIAARGRPLSDHFAVHGRFVFEAASRPPGPGTFPFVELFDGEDARRDFICNVSLEEARRIDLEDHPECGDARVRWIRLRDVPAGRVIRFFDGPSARRDTDWTEILPKRFLASQSFDTLEINIETADVRVIHVRRNGLGGRVSRIEISALPPTGPADLD